MADTDLTAEQLRDLGLVRASLKANGRTQNPYVRRDIGGTFEVRFVVPNKEPLHWNGNGFKDLSRLRGEPEVFVTAEEAETKLRAELLGFIRQWRSDQTHLILGWV